MNKKITQINQILGEYEYSKTLNDDSSNKDEIGKLISSELIKCSERISGKLKDRYINEKSQLEEKARDLTIANRLINTFY